MSYRHERERRAVESYHRYLSFWGIVCLSSAFVFGWPTLLAWLGAAWVLTTFLQLLLRPGNDSSPKPPCSKHR